METICKQNNPYVSTINRGFRALVLTEISYTEGLALQEALLLKRLQQEDDILVLLEHLPVITLGRSASRSNLLLSDSEYDRYGISRVNVNRGGDVTYHGPGQLVGYAIIDLKPLGKDIHGYLRMLEEVLIDVLKKYSIIGHRVAGKTGVWVDGKKIASIGIGVRKWISWHGFSLNVAANLSGFSSIIPCGLKDVTMTSLESLLGCEVSLEDVKQKVISSFGDIFISRYKGLYE
jgi:lipoyl(octanoyl) transferase